jgi:hypothetical protein
LRAGVDFGRRIREIAASRAVCFIGKARSESSAALDDDAMSGPRQLWNDVGNEGDASFAARDLARDSYQHVVWFRGIIGAP